MADLLKLNQVETDSWRVTSACSQLTGGQTEVARVFGITTGIITHSYIGSDGLSCHFAAGDDPHRYLTVSFRSITPDRPCTGYNEAKIPSGLCMTSPSTIGSDAIVAPVQGDYLDWKDKVVSHAKTSGDTTIPQPPTAPSETALVPKGQTKIPTSTASGDDITKACLSLVGEPAAVADFLAWQGTAGSARLAADINDGALSCYYSVYGNKNETLQVFIAKATSTKPGTTDGNPAVHVEYTYPMSSMDGYQMHAWMDRIAKATTI